MSCAGSVVKKQRQNIMLPIMAAAITAAGSVRVLAVPFTRLREAGLPVISPAQNANKAAVVQ